MTKIIAELCQNHNGDISVLEEMVHAAAESGAEYAKIQSMLSKDLTHRKRFDEGLVEGGEIRVKKRPYSDELDRLSKLDLDDDQHHLFLEFCSKYKIKPMTTIFNRSRLKFIQDLNFELIKISSFDCASHKMIEEISKSKFKEIIVSTGCTYDHEIKRTSEILKDKDFTLMHCVSIYPTPLSEVHLERINYLRNFAKNVGMSEHSNSDKDGLKISISSLMYDVKYIERHFTILPKDQTKDGIVSLNPEELKFLCDMSKKSKKEITNYISEDIKEFDQMKGLKQRELSAEELMNRDYYRGRFASFNAHGEAIYNWEDKPI
jgi:N,N'-diacetyllegionaminate synthase